MRISYICLCLARNFSKKTMSLHISGILIIGLMLLGSSSIYEIPFLAIAEGVLDPYKSLTPPYSGIHTSGNITNAFVYLSNNIVNTSAYYDVVFITASSNKIATIDIEFPMGTDVTNASIIEVSGVYVGSVAVKGQIITYTIKKNLLVQSGTTIRLGFANVLNPADPNFNLRVHLTTKASDGSIIDSGQSFLYSIKEPGRVYTVHSGNVTVGPPPIDYGNGTYSYTGPPHLNTDTAYADCGKGFAISGGYVFLNLMPLPGGPPSASIVYDGPNGHSWKVTAKDVGYYANYATTFYAWATCILLS